MASQPLVTSCSLPDHSPRSVSWQVLNKQLGVLLTELGVIMLCNCGVRACLPVEIRNAKSFPVFKSKGKILTSDTGFPSFDYCGAPRSRLWRSLFRIPGSQTMVLSPEPTPEKTENAPHWLTLQAISLKSWQAGSQGMGESHLGMDYLWGALQKQEGVCAKGIWHMLKGKSTFFLIVQILVFYSTLNFKRKGSKIEHLFFSHINSTPNKYWAELPQTHLWADKQFHAHKASCSVLKISLDCLLFLFLCPWN